MILTDLASLNHPCLPVESPEEALEISDKLAAALDASPVKGIGLAANQIGIQKQVCLLRIPEKDSRGFKYDIEIALANPVITELSDPIKLTGEGCLSFPEKIFTTLRYRRCIVTDMLQPKGRHLEGVRAICAQHECLPANAVIETEDGPRTIRSIVTEKYSGKVASLDEEGRLCYRQVIGWSRLPNYGKKWLAIKSSATGPNIGLVCTEDHKCATVTDILESPIISYVRAQDVLGLRLVRQIRDRPKNAEIGLFNKQQVSALIGSCLGDACLEDNGTVTMNHGEPQREYAEYLAEIFNGKVVRGWSGFRNEMSNFCANVRGGEQARLLWQMMYKPKKNPLDVIKYLDEIALAFWFMDDGCLKKRTYARKRNLGTSSVMFNSQFHTEGFLESQVEILVLALNEKFGIKAAKARRKVRGKYKFLICLGKSGTERLAELISPYVHPSLRYKLPPAFREAPFVKINNARLDFSCRLVKYADPVFKESALYDIEVEGSHCYFANCTLVHNCDHLAGLTMLDRLFENVKPNSACPCGRKSSFKECCRGSVREF